MSDLIKSNKELLEQEKILSTKHSTISDVPTPKTFIKQKAGFDYVDEAYMRNQLNKYFPIWKWEILKYEFIGDKVITVHGRLTIIDNGIERHFDSVDAHRIAVSRDGGNYVDLGNDLKAANTDAFKVAVNRLCNIADDVYRKNIPNLVLSLEQISDITDLSQEVGNYEVIEPKLQDLSINSINYEATMRKLKQMKEPKNGISK